MLPIASFNHSKTMLLRLKIHIFCLVIHPDKQTNVNHSAFSRHIINIRYLLIFQIEKYFVLSFYLKQELLIKGNPKNLRFGTKRNNKTIVLSDMLSLVFERLFYSGYVAMAKIRFTEFLPSAGCHHSVCPHYRHLARP